MGDVIIHIMLITGQEYDNLEDVVSLVTLSSAEASLYRREGWREGKRKRVGDDGKGIEKNRLFPPPIAPRALSIFQFLLFLSGYPAGASAEERGLVMNTARNNRQNLLGYFFFLFLLNASVN